MRLRNIFPYILFVTVLITVSQWSQLLAVLTSFSEPKVPVEIVSDPVLSEFVLSKTRVHISEFKLIHSDKPFAMMVGLPGNPQLFISKKLYETFDQQATEYVLLHELGHYLKNHSVREFVWGVVSLLLGFVVLKRARVLKTKVIGGLVLGVVLGIGLIQIGRIHEFEADRYALSKLDDPQAMISATEKLEKQAVRAPTIVETLLYRRVPYEVRYEMAKEMGAL